MSELSIDSVTVSRESLHLSLEGITITVPATGDAWADAQAIAREAVTRWPWVKVEADGPRLLVTQR